MVLMLSLERRAQVANNSRISNLQVFCFPVQKGSNLLMAFLSSDHGWGLALVICQRRVGAVLQQQFYHRTISVLRGGMNRDPTSILHAINKIKSNLDTLQPDITEIERRIALHKEK